MSDKPLTDKQKRFAQEYIVDLNGKQAAIRAEYSAATAEQQASRLLSNVKVSEYLQTLMNKRSERTEVDADYVIKGFMDLHNQCTGKAKVRVSDSEGNDIEKYIYEHAGAGKALESLGKHLKMFTEKHEHVHRLDDMSDDDLENKLRQLEDE